MNLNLPPRLCMISLLTLFASAPAIAEHEGGKKHMDRQDRQDNRHHESERNHFDDSNRRAIHDYYGARFRKGLCPHGLIKKHQDCVPPGHARQWAMGHPLPPHLKHDQLPHELMLRLPPPPEGHRYVRVATDILLIAIGTGMVVDAIEDIGR